MSGLYIVGTPIGHLGDISPRAVETLRAVEQILAEDTRRTRAMLTALDVHTPLRSCHAFNEAAVIGAVLDRLRAGAAIALVTDSGMPAVSDPGARLVSACRRADIAVRVVPGPSAVTSAVAASGFGGHGFVFVGFAPRKRSGRIRCFETWTAASNLPLVFFEAPHRILSFLRDAAAVWEGRELYVGRELTKKFEEHAWGTAAELGQRFDRQPPRGEFVLVVSGKDAPPPITPPA